MLRLLKTRLAFRSAVLILVILGLVGTLFLGVGRYLVAEGEEQRHHELLVGLLNTVDNTVRIAAFLGDKELAGEVVSGLVQNRTVKSVTIKSGDSVLARRGGAADPSTTASGENATPLTRQVVSPFNEEEVIGSIELVPNQQAIDEEVASGLRFVTVFFFAQLVVVALSIVLVVIRLITRPIQQISRRLHGLEVETGEHLEFPRGSETDEIGTLVRDVNAMIDHLVNILGEERQLRLEREMEEKKFRAIVDNAETGIFQLDAAGMIVSSNPAFRRLFSATSRDIEHHNLRFTELLGESAAEVETLIRQTRQSKETHRFDIKLSGAGGTRWLNVIVHPIDNHQLQGVANDITERKLAQAAAEEQAVTDPLTGISNRLGFERKMQWLIETALRYPEHRFALIMIDLDLFKEVNDTYGHLAGDEVLMAVTNRFRELLRKTDFVARLGGDEFAIIIDASDERDVLSGIAEKIIETANQPITVEHGVSVRVGASLGIAIYSRAYSSASELTRDADLAMYRSKHAGRNTYHFYDDMSDA